jgi:NodT family efflux transporter outer membrane factor (OMF) lipoprotein
MRAAMALSALTMLSACAVGPDYHAPKPLTLPASQLTEAQGLAAVTQEELPGRWWRLFNAPDLDRLVEKALIHNSDVRIAAANLQRARALLSESGAARLPITNAGASATRARTAPDRGGTGDAADYYSVGFDASYEVDLFGGVSRSIEAARGDLGTAGGQLDAARVAVAAETARTYASACGFGLQADVARTTATLQQKTQELTQRLFKGGSVSQREVDQATVLFEQANAQAATFEAEHRAALYALAVLTGEPPAQIDAAAAQCVTVPSISSPIPIGDGQSMLARRPDVRAAERTLAADTARIGVATAALFPSITLLGSITLGGADVKDIGKRQGFSWSAGPLISWNFPFNGAARARVRENRAIADGSLAAFDKAVLTALQETEQALARLAGALDREAALRRAQSAADQVAFLSDKRFSFGADNFLDLLDAQRTRAAANGAMAAAEADRAEAQIALFKALGGGWQDAAAPVRPPVFTQP